MNNNHFNISQTAPSLNDNPSAAAEAIARIDKRIPTKTNSIARFYKTVHEFNILSAHVHVADGLLSNRCTQYFTVLRSILQYG